jgi:hypothetical protein
MVSPVLKIYILPVHNDFRPQHGFIAPAHNSDFGVENDFECWLREHPEYITHNPDEADWMYLSIYWNRYYCQYWGNHTDELQDEILKLVSRNRPTFTIVEYDPQVMQPNIDLCNMTIFTASRQGEKGIDIPLLCSPHQEIPLPDDRRCLASFMGKFETSDYRSKMQEKLKHRPDIILFPSMGTRAYVELMANSEIALAPRGHGGQSFRFYEAMQFETVPFLIGDLDTRPFKKWIDWDACSLYTDNMNEIEAILDSGRDWRAMGREARRLWQDELHYGKLEPYIIKVLDDLLQ